MNQICPCCNANASVLLKTVHGYNYFNCLLCDTIFIDTAWLQKIDDGFNIIKYEEGYWEMELESARKRSYGQAMARMAEAVYYCKRPISKFLDIGTGPGYFLDAVKKLLPDNAHVFYGVELYPPEPQFRTDSPNYIMDDLGNLTHKFDCGMCIEVIEHLTPNMLDGVFKKLAAVSNTDALYVFNTGMPDYVKKEDIAYLDPLTRGHLVSYSIKAVTIMAAKHGFTAHRIIGKTWAFVLEFSNRVLPEEDIRDRIWKAAPDNLKILCDSKMGNVLQILGMETVRAYN